MLGNNSTKPAVLYLTYDGLTDPLGQSQILPYLCGLSEHYKISIISFEKKERYLIEKKTIEAICQKNSLFWYPLTYHKNPPVFSTLFDLTALWAKASSLHKNQNFSIVHCRSYITSLIGLRLKKKYNVRFIFDMRGFWADERVEGGIWRLNNPVYKVIYTFFKKKESNFLTASDDTVTLTHAAGQYISKNYSTTSLTVIPCCVDTAFFNRKNQLPESRTRLLAQLGLSTNDYILGYVGSLGTWYLYDEMIIFFDLLKSEMPNAKMLFLTPDKHKVAQRDDFVVLTSSRADMPAYISLFNASVCFIKPTFSKSASSATKIAEVLSMGVPMVVNAGWGDISTVPAFSKAGVIIESTDQAGLVKGVHSLRSISVSASEIRETSVGYFSLASGIKKYKEIYDRLTA